MYFYQEKNRLKLIDLCLSLTHFFWGLNLPKLKDKFIDATYN